MNFKGEKVVVLFSGGTDSTLTAALLQETFQEIHLITYNRFGFHETGNTSVQVEMLQNKYGNKKFIHHVINVDKLFRFVSYENYWKNTFKYGFFNLSTCGLCKLSMHVRTVEYCIEHNIKFVADGANQAMNVEPTQMKSVIDIVKRMYADFEIIYFNPVFNLEGPEDKGYLEKENLQFLNSRIGYSEISTNTSIHTPGYKLFKMGLAPSPNIKGSDYDRKRQPRCFQFILFNIFALKYFMATNTYENYEKKAIEFYSSKVSRMIEYIRDNSKNKKNNGLI